MNDSSNLDETQRESSLDLNDDLIRFWRGQGHSRLAVEASRLGNQTPSAHFAV